MMYHVIRAEPATEDRLYLTYCGKEQRSNFGLVKTPDQISHICPKCSSRYYAELVKDSPYSLGERLNLSQDRRRDTYKSIYEVHDSNGLAIGFVAIKNGYGRGWEVHAWEDGDLSVAEVKAGAEAPEPVMSFHTVSYRSKPDNKFETSASGFSSKEQALFLVPMMVEQGKLPSRDAVFAQSKERIIAFRRQIAHQNAQRQLLAEREAERMQLLTEEFSAMIASGKLTNRQSHALTTAAELLGVKLA